MSVKDFECQIARGQIGRYVGGEMLSPEALRQLGLHVAECEDCRDHLDKRRSALQSMVSSGASKGKQIQEPVRSGQTAASAGGSRMGSSGKAAVSPAAQALMDQIRRKAGDGLPLQDKQPTLAPPAEVVAPKALSPLFGKPAMYSIALAAVLIGMTYISKNPTSFFGPKLNTVNKLSASKAETGKADTGKADTGKAVAATTTTSTPPPSTPAPSTPAPSSASPSAASTPGQGPASTVSPTALPPTGSAAPIAGYVEGSGHEPVGHGPLVPQPQAPAPVTAQAPAPATGSTAGTSAASGNSAAPSVAPTATKASDSASPAQVTRAAGGTRAAGANGKPEAQTDHASAATHESVPGDAVSGTAVSGGGAQSTTKPVAAKTIRQKNGLAKKRVGLRRRVKGRIHRRSAGGATIHLYAPTQ